MDIRKLKETTGMNFNNFRGKKILKASNEEKLHSDIESFSGRGWSVGSEMKYIASDKYPYQILMKYSG